MWSNFFDTVQPGVPFGGYIQMPHMVWTPTKYKPEQIVQFVSLLQNNKFIYSSYINMTWKCSFSSREFQSSPNPLDYFWKLSNL